MFRESLDHSTAVGDFALQRMDVAAAEGNNAPAEEINEHLRYFLSNWAMVINVGAIEDHMWKYCEIESIQRDTFCIVLYGVKKMEVMNSVGGFRFIWGRITTTF